MSEDDGGHDIIELLFTQLMHQGKSNHPSSFGT